MRWLQKKDVEQLADMLTELKSRNIQSYLYVLNHFEGSALKTITLIKAP